jgi:hypothetical protein
MSISFKDLVDNVRVMMNTGLGQQSPSAVWTMTSEQAGNLEGKYKAEINALKKENKELKTSLELSYHAKSITDDILYWNGEKFYQKERELKKSLKTAQDTIAEGAKVLTSTIAPITKEN